jgi:hypothetical protein
MAYMQIETGTSTLCIKPRLGGTSGYDRIALMTMRAIVHDQAPSSRSTSPNRGIAAVPGG